MASILHRHLILDVVKHGRRLVELPHTATVGDALQAMLSQNILAIPIAARPGSWIGAGDSSIIESDPKTGLPRKQYIGIISVLDVLIHLAEKEHLGDVEWVLNASVSSLIGHSDEGLALWTLSPTTPLYEAMEPLSKGVHRALVPMEIPEDSHGHTSQALETMDSTAGYRMLTQSDLVRHLLKWESELTGLMGQSISSLGAIKQSVFAVPASMRVLNAVQCMQQVSLTTVAVVEASLDLGDDPMLAVGKGRRVISTFSASNLRGCNAQVLQVLPQLSVQEFLLRLSLAEVHGYAAAFGREQLQAGVMKSELPPPSTCSSTSSFKEVMQKLVGDRAHIVWVVDSNGCLEGTVTLSDIIRAIRQAV